MQTRLDHHLAGTSSNALAGPLRPATSRRLTSISKKSTGRATGPLPLPRFGAQTLTETSSRDVSCDAHCAIPWEIAEKSLVDPAGKDACGVGCTCTTGWVGSTDDSKLDSRLCPDGRSGMRPEYMHSRNSIDLVYFADGSVYGPTMAHVGSLRHCFGWLQAASIIAACSCMVYFGYMYCNSALGSA
jgi:hypothetical protein